MTSPNDSASSGEKKMDQELKAKWVAALRSGKYEQTHNALHREGDGFCCLGVLCDVIDPTRWAAPTPGAKGVLADALSYDGYVHTFPTPNLLERHRADFKLMEMNDRYGKSFSEIADWIEAYL